MQLPATIDFETRSACSLKSSGSWRYSLDSSTQVLCLAFRLPHWAPGRTGLWHPEFRSLGIRESTDYDDLWELFQWVESGQPIEAHNAWFERGIWKNQMAPVYGWPEIRQDQWRCSAAKAAAHTLPRALEDAGEVLDLDEQKDMEGSALMKKLTKPRKPRKKEREEWKRLHGSAPMPLLWWESVDWFEQLWAYCRQDVLAEEALSATVPPLSDKEHELYLLDQRINERGFQLDIAAVESALRVVTKETPRLNDELKTLTGGQVEKATQRAKMIQWFSGKGLYLPNTQKKTLQEALLTPGLSMPVVRGLELMIMLGKSSTAKYKSMKNWMCPDGRVRGGLLFHGAGTGRWSGAGVQPHNFVKGFIKDMEALWSALKTEERSIIMDVITRLSKGKCRDLLNALSQALRGVIVAPPGRKLLVADYAGIEPRVLMWLAGQDDALKAFRQGDIYCDMATAIYGKPILANPDNQPPERQLGKCAIIGLGYQMGAPKFVATAASWGIPITEDFARQVVETYRTKYWRVPRLWRDQEQAAMAAALDRDGRVVKAGKLSWYTIGDYLYCELPSGRRLAYPEPSVREVTTSWGAQKQALTFTGISSYSRKWERRSAYGGLIVENEDQAISRDLMAHAVTSCDTTEIYDLVLTVHDELIAEAEQHEGSLEEFIRILTTLPDWAEGCPIDAEGWVGTRYHK